ncbi:MAG: FRG domain-containing protein [Lachnospiraceae bacterium]|nr:FRG domain-containing protein [Lachnospiraceae bacterium]
MFDVSFATAVKRKTSKVFNSFIIPSQGYYSHPTFCISTLADYVRLISVISSINKDPIYDQTVIYRGMADQDYDLKPSLARIKNLEIDTEAVLINDFLTRRPDAFSGLTEFDMLGKMQHYGLPTRILDFSLNPLVSLYFACDSKTTKNGRVLCHSTDLQNDTSVVVNAICSKAVKKGFDDVYTVDEYLCDDGLTLRKYLSEVYLYNETLVVRPKYWNQRIANQSGLFMLFFNNIYDRYRRILIHGKELGLEKALQDYSFGKIDRTKVEQAWEQEPIEFYRKENTAVLTEECFAKMFNSYSDDDKKKIFWDNLSGRFQMDCSIKELSRSKIQNSFCSIIIEAKSKKKILKDLSSIGISADYIYPELEYTAMEIKRKYENN